MEVRTESATPNSDQVAGMALNIPVNDSNNVTTLFLPRRLRRRLLETRTPSAITAQDIETKLKDAELRRQVVIFSYSFSFVPIAICLILYLRNCCIQFARKGNIAVDLTLYL